MTQISPPRRICAVKDSIPTYREGILRALAAIGYETAEPECCINWMEQWRHGARAPDGAAVLLSVRGTDDLDEVSQLRALNSEVVLLALLVDPSVHLYSHALEAGASGAVDYAATPAEIVGALEVTWVGDVRLPHPVAFALAAQSRQAPPEASIEKADIDRLSALANGWSVEQIARHENFSKRAMFRRLNALYRQLGVSNRHQAIAWAARHGLLDDAVWEQCRPRGT